MQGQFTYKAFISYSHAVDAELGCTLERSLERFAKPWYRRRKFNVFRDQTTLAVTPHLWGAIERALEQSEYFILLASPESARSPWVAKEMEYWLEHRGVESLLIVLSGGDLAWSAVASGIDPAQSSAIPAQLRDAFVDEPLFVDMRWTRDATRLSDRDARFRDCVAGIAATLHGKPKDDLVGEDIVQHRRTLRIAWGAAAGLGALALVSMLTSIVAVSQRDLARERERVAQARELALQSTLLLQEEPSQIERSALLAIESLAHKWTTAGQRSLRASLTLMPKRVQRLGKAGFMYDLRFSPDGEWLASASEHGATLWEIASGDYVDVHSNVKIRQLAFHPVDDYLVTAGDDASARVWHSRSGEAVAVHAQSASLYALAISADGRWLATGGADGNARVVDFASGEIQMEWDVSDDKIHAVEFSASGRFFAAVAGDGPVGVFDIDADWSRVVLADAPVGAGLDVAFSGDETRVAATRDNRVAVWSLEDGRHITTLAHSDYLGDADMAFHVWINSIAFSPDGTLIATAGRDGTARIWNPESGEELVRMSHSYQVMEIRFTPDNRFVATTAPGETRLWELPHGREVSRLAFTGGNMELDVSPDGARFASADEDMSIALWQHDSADRVATMRHPDDVKRVACGPNGVQVATIDDQHDVRVWKTDGTQLPGAAHLFNSRSLKFSADSRFVTVNGQTGLHRVDIGADMTPTQIAHYDTKVAYTTQRAAVVHRSVSKVRLFSLSGGEELSAPDTNDVTDAIALSAGDSYLATTHAAYGDDTRDYNVVRVWRLADNTLHWEVTIDNHFYPVAINAGGDKLAVDDRLHVTLYTRGSDDPPRVLRHDDEVDGTFFEPTGERLVTVAASNVYVWTVAADTEPLVLAHDAEVRWISFSDDGYYATTAAGSVVSVWDLTRGSLLSRWSTGRRIHSACFLDNANYVVTGDSHNDAIIWRWRENELVDLACERLSRNLTKAEWSRYLGGAPYAKTCANLPHPDDDESQAP